jgi:hypothetical protein
MDTDRKRERAQALEAADAEAVVDGDEDARDVAPLVLTGARPEPVVERRDAAGNAAPSYLPSGSIAVIMRDQPNRRR